MKREDKRGFSEALWSTFGFEPTYVLKKPFDKMDCQYDYKDCNDCGDCL